MPRPKAEQQWDWILVARLRQAYWPRIVAEWLEDPADIRSSKTQKKYVSTAWRSRSLSWNRGRVRYFYDLLICGEEIDPISIDNQCRQYRAGHPIQWGGPFIDDGHHRFAAAILARKRKIKASLSGLLSTHRWLRGEVPLKSMPPELTC
jgi:hypothetical protein